MRLAGKISAAIEVLEDFQGRRVPLKTTLADWARGARYAGAKDRAWISGLCLDVLRQRQSLAVAMDGETARGLVLGALRFLWQVPLTEIAEAASEDPHGPGALTDAEVTRLESSYGALLDGAEDWQRGDYPEWLDGSLKAVFGDRTVDVMSTFANRADIDLRLNTLKATPEKSIAALKPIKGEAIPLLKTAARVHAPDPSERAPAVTVIPAFNKGWVEVQDLGSQIAAAAAGNIKGKQVLDFCAGGGGKTLALGALMENSGQLYAYDIDARRLKPLFHRAKRAGLRNLQVRSPAGGETLDDLPGKMDVVFVDAPCTGSGTWRRHPDTKWRLTEKQLERRIKEQETVLDNARRYVKPGGTLVYVTCSILREENEDRIEAFLGRSEGVRVIPTLDGLKASENLVENAAEILAKSETQQGFLRLSPDQIKADGFFVAAMVCD